MSLAIWGLGTATPEHRIDQEHAARIAQTLLGDGGHDRPVAALFRRTQVRSRASVLLERTNGSPTLRGFYRPSFGPEDRGPATALRMQRYAEEAVPLAAAACRRALEAAGLAAPSVTHLLTVSCTGFFAPGVDLALVRQLGLMPSVGRLHVGFMGCHGALNALRAAQAIATSEPQAVVLLCAVELCSLHYQYGRDAQKLVANALFADGAAAMVGRAEPPRSDAWRVVASGSYLLPGDEEGMTWRIGDHGFEMTLSPRVPQQIATHLRPWLESWLASAGLRLDQVGSWAVHPGGPRVLASVTEALGLPASAVETSAEVLAEWGNMSSPTVLFVLERLRRLDAPRPCVLLGFGPGLVAEAALVE